MVFKHNDIVATTMFQFFELYSKVLKLPCEEFPGIMMCVQNTRTV